MNGLQQDCLESTELPSRRRRPKWTFSRVWTQSIDPWVKGPARSCCTCLLRNIYKDFKYLFFSRFEFSEHSSIQGFYEKMVIHCNIMRLKPCSKISAAHIDNINNVLPLNISTMLNCTIRYSWLPIMPR